MITACWLLDFEAVSKSWAEQVQCSVQRGSMMLLRTNAPSSRVCSCAPRLHHPPTHTTRPFPARMASAAARRPTTCLRPQPVRAAASEMSLPQPSSSNNTAPAAGVVCDAGNTLDPEASDSCQRLVHQSLGCSVGGMCRVSIGTDIVLTRFPILSAGCGDLAEAVPAIQSAE